MNIQNLTQKDIEKIKNYYEIEVTNINRILVNPKHQERTSQNVKMVTYFDKTFVFRFGENVKTFEEAEKNNNCIVANGKDFYMKFFNWNFEDYLINMYGVDLRSYNYLKDLEKNIGIIKPDKQLSDYEYWKSTYDYLPVTNDEEIVVTSEIGRIHVSIGLYKDNIWCSQYSVQTDIDDYYVCKYLFNQKPTKDDVITKDNIDAIESYFIRGEKRYLFTCKKCNKLTHWLDIKGNFLEKMSNILDDKNHCGC